MNQYENRDFWYQTGQEISQDKPDVFYVVSTMIVDSYDNAGNKSVLAVLNAEDRALLDEEFKDISTNMFNESFNFFAPYYHEITMSGVVGSSPEKRIELFEQVGSEVCKAFDYYMEHLNNGRPFVLAGYSQGAIVVKSVLSHMTDKQYSLMAAAYAMGGPLTAADLQKPHIIPARGADDIGVTISYNSVANLEACWDLLTAGTIECINPLNWTTGEEPAALSYQGETGTVHVDTKSHMLIVEGIDPKKHYEPEWAFPCGNYHVEEIHFYADSIRENALLRLKKLQGK